MRRKGFVFSLIVLFLLPLFVGCGKKPDLRCTLTLENKVVLEKEYASSLFPLKRRDLASDCRKKGLSPLAYLQKICPELASDVESCCESAFVKKVEPEIVYLGEGKFEYKGGNVGRVASADEVATLLINSNGNFAGEIPCRVVSPAFDIEDLTEHTKKMASFSSEYATSSDERKHNIALAAQKLDNIVIGPHDVLSFNQAVGKRTKENGFREAGVILYGQFTRGVGGGVCQVSTTLYNAWNLAGLAAEGQNHSLAVSYVSPGLDAMVSESSDLTLTNNGEYPVYLDADCDGKKITFTLYGTPSKERVLLWSQKIENLPCDEYELVTGEEEKILSLPKDGSVYRSYRDFYDGDRLIKREKLRVSRYKKVKGKKIVPSLPENE